MQLCRNKEEVSYIFYESTHLRCESDI